MTFNPYSVTVMQILLSAPTHTVGKKRGGEIKWVNIRGVKLILTRGHISLAVAFKGPK